MIEFFKNLWEGQASTTELVIAYVVITALALLVVLCITDDDLVLFTGCFVPFVNIFILVLGFLMFLENRDRERVLSKQALRKIDQIKSQYDLENKANKIKFIMETQKSLGSVKTYTVSELLEMPPEYLDTVVKHYEDILNERG